MPPFPLPLLAQIQQNAPFQPATNLWRAVEVAFLVEKALPALKKAQKIVDLGCGDGEIMRLIKPHLPQGLFLTGIDPDWQEVALAAQTGLYAKLMACEGHDVDLPDASQDAIISNSVLEHIPDLDAVLLESARILKPEGLLIATVPSADFHACLKGAQDEKYLRALDQRLAHVHYLDATAWKDRLAQAGLVLENALPYLDRAQTRRWELLSNITGGLLHRLSGGQRPIALQRSLRLREGRKMPAWAATILAHVLATGLDQNKVSSFSCLLLVARKA